MNKEKKFYIIIVVLTIALGACITVNFTLNNSKKNNRDVDIINIDCDDENCEKKVVPSNDKDKQNNEKNPSTDEKNNKDKNGTRNENGSGSGNGTIPGDGSGTINGSGTNGTGTGPGTNTGSGDGPGTGNGSGNGSGTGTAENTENNTSDDTTVDNNNQEGNLTVGDNNQVWKQNTELKIFNVPTIAPGDSGIYDFFINNNTNGNVMYNIVFNEENLYNVNMLYKLKRNGKYIAGSSTEWISYSNLNIGEKVLNSKNNDYYTIEWKWVDSDNDTAVGRTPGATYRLNVAIKAAETDKFDVSGGSGFNPETGDNILYYIELAILSIIILLLIILKRRQKD